MDYHSFGAASDAHLLLLRDEVADVGGRRRCHHHVPGTVPHRRRVRAHAGGYTLSGSPGATENVKCADGTLARADSGRSRGKTDACVSLRSLCDLFIPRTTVLSSRSNLRFWSCTRIQSANSRAAARRSHSRRFWVLEHGPSLFSSETALSSRTCRAWDTTRVSAPPGRPRTRSHRQATHRATERKALRTHGRARSFFGPRDISRYNCSSKRR